MALCRFTVFPKPLTSFFPNYPHKSPEFMHLPLLLQKPTHRVSSSALHSSSSSMESAPEGYRRNVGVCLINPSKKVSAFLFGYVCIVFVCWYVYMFVLGLWDFLFLGRFLLLQGWIYPILGKCRRYIFRFLFCLIFEWGILIWLLLKVKHCVWLLRSVEN
jgi:hypothetical protein